MAALRTSTGIGPATTGTTSPSVLSKYSGKSKRALEELFWVGKLRWLLRLSIFQRFKDRIQIPIEDGVDVGPAFFDAMIGDPILWEVVSADLLDTLTGAYLFSAFFSDIAG